jgi:hypothetical protein
MISEQLLEELKQLNHADKLRIVQLLVNQMADAEALLTGTLYEVWTPLDTPGAAAVLMDMLKENQQRDE